MEKALLILLVFYAIRSLIECWAYDKLRKDLEDLRETVEVNKTLSDNEFEFIQRRIKNNGR